MSGDRWAKHPVTEGVVARDHLTTQGVDPQPETWKVGTEATPLGDTTTAREALVLALDPLMPTVWAQDIADDLLAGTLSDRDVCAALPPVAAIMRELDDVIGAQKRELDEARAKLARVEDYHRTLDQYTCLGCYGTWPCATVRVLDGTP